MKGNLQQWSDRFESETINIFREKEIVFTCELYICSISYLRHEEVNN